MNVEQQIKKNETRVNVFVNKKLAELRIAIDEVD